jgi:hypothetical protein
MGSKVSGLAAAGEPGSMGMPEIVGYLTMIAAFSLVFIGIKRHRDQRLGGSISFTEALKVGLGITVVASFIYVLTWEVYLAATNHAFINDYAASIIAEAEQTGMGDSDLESLKAEMDAMKVQYAKLPFRLVMTFLEIFPVGLLISLVSAVLLRKESFMAARD